MDAVLAAVSGLQILAEDQDAGARIHQHAARDRGLVDAGRAQPPQMLERHDVAAGEEPEQIVVERRRQRQRIGAAIAAVIELGRGGEHVLQGMVRRRPVAAGDLLMFLDRQ